MIITESDVAKLYHTLQTSDNYWGQTEMTKRKYRDALKEVLKYKQDCESK